MQDTFPLVKRKYGEERPGIKFGPLTWVTSSEMRCTAFAIFFGFL